MEITLLVLDGEKVLELGPTDDISHLITERIVDIWNFCGSSKTGFIRVECIHNNRVVLTIESRECESKVTRLIISKLRFLLQLSVNKINKN